MFISKVKKEQIESKISSLDRDNILVMDQLCNLDNRLSNDLKSLEQRIAAIEGLSNDLKSLEQRIAAIEEQFAEEDIQQKEEPMIQISSETAIDENGRVTWLMDWNAAFIEELTKYGYTGTDEEMVQKYLGKSFAQNLDD